MIRGFRHACIVVSDLKRSLKFYRDVIGLKVVKILTIEGECPDEVFNTKGVKLTYAKLRSNDQPMSAQPVIELHYWLRPKRFKKPGFNHIAFTVKNIEREYKRLKKAGVKFISKPVKVTYSNSKICFGYDSDNNLIEFIEDL